MSVQEKLTAVADAVRAHTGTAEPLTLDQMAEAIPDVAETGRQTGIDEMWDKLQNSGKRTDYRYAFFYTGFQQLKPKHQIKAANADSIMCGMSNLEAVDWSRLDLTAAASLYSAFAFCYKLTAIDTDLALSTGTATLLNSVCRQCTSLTRVQKITAFPSAVWKNSFDNCKALTHVIFDGTIGANGLNLQWSTGLDRESIESIINALSDDTSGLSITLSLTAVDDAFGTESTSGSESGEWAILIGTKPNWTISLV